jgi:hypothetical protein
MEVKNAVEVKLVLGIYVLPAERAAGEVALSSCPGCQRGITHPAQATRA